MLWYCSTRPRGRRANAADIGEGSAKWKMVTSPARRVRVRERPHLVAHVVIDREREDVGLVPHPAQQIPHPASAVADRVTSMRRRHPLVDTHRLMRNSKRERHRTTCIQPGRTTGATLPGAGTHAFAPSSEC